MTTLLTLFKTRGEAEMVRDEILSAGIGVDSIDIATKDDLNEPESMEAGKRGRALTLLIVSVLSITLFLALCTLIVPGVGYVLSAAAILIIVITRPRDTISEHREELLSDLTLLVVRSPRASTKNVRKILQRYETLSERRSS